VKSGETSGREGAKVWGPAALLTLAGFLLAYQFVEPAPPRTLVLATGSESGAYHAYGLRYAERLAAYDITLELLPSAGSGANVEHLLAGEADVAFVQGGTVPPEAVAELEGIASLYLEPLWILHRADLEVARLSDLAGRRIQVGPAGSGTQAVTATLLSASGVLPGDAELLELSNEEAAAELLAGSIDAAFLVVAPHSDVVAELMAAEGESVHLFDVERHLAHVRNFPYLAHTVLGEGALDLARNLPDREIDLVAPTAGLLARADLHPAVVPLFVQAAEELHGDGDLLAPPRTFPSSANLDVPLSAAAREYFTNGRSFLYRVLPFRLAAALDRLKILILPLVTLLFPLFKVAGPLYQWRIRRKIYRWYGAIKRIEDRTRESADADLAGSCLEELRTIEREIEETVRVPASYMEELYNLRMHLGQARERLDRTAVRPAPGAGT
jgi:TRAP transporter TAXI family solute receptor